VGQHAGKIAPDCNILDEPAPCDDCPHAHRCAVEHLACRAFSHYIRDLSWRSTPREPAAWRFNNLFTAA
jgi:hypothetical protein